MGTTKSKKKWVYKNGELFTANNKNVVPKTGAVSNGLVLCPQSSFPQRKANYGKVALRKLHRNLPESRKRVRAIVPISCREKAYNKPCKECPATNESSNFSVFDRDRFDGLSQVQPRSQGPLSTSRKYPGYGWSRVC